MISDRPLFGIFLMLCFCALAPVVDATAKVLGETIPLLQLLIVRFGAQAVFLLPFSWKAGVSWSMSRRLLGLTVLRTVLHIIGIGTMYTSLRFLPLADAIAIAFVMPFIMLLLGRVVLNEMVGPRRLGACVVGFIGTLFVIQPSFELVGAPALLPLVVAVVFALFMLITRQVAKEIDPIGLQYVSGVMGTVGLFGLLVLGRTFDLDGSNKALFDLVIPNLKEILLLLVIGGVGTFAHLLMTWSLRFAPSATVAPMQYLEIPFATFVGWLVFRDLPNGLAALGIVITVCAGLYIVFRERRLARAIPAEA